ncbi:hypothetical protein ANN_16818 [Periplaneta americana]|uniref:Endonuclease/exonuclease/phosphatase domain-containing protein n=1 Tax=Periplaneta americana TaxID=6978 RepID=A0ABQ8SSN4_PERAM|nr:hypothetical protein ANN_16818 [Periplaneta americana]
MPLVEPDRKLVAPNCASFFLRLLLRAEWGILSGSKQQLSPLTTGKQLFKHSYSPSKILERVHGHSASGRIISMEKIHDRISKGWFTINRKRESERKRKRQLVYQESRSHPLRIVTWNANGIQRDKYLLQHFLQQYDVDIFLITETHLQQNDRLSIPKYSIYRQDGPNGRQGGAAIAIKSYIMHNEIPCQQPQHLQIVAVQIPVHKEQLLIGSVYAPPSRPLTNKDLDTITTISPNFLLGGDFNSKHTNWNYHNPVIGILDVKPTELHHNHLYLRHTNWQRFRNSLKENVPGNITITSTQDIDTSCHIITNTIKQAYIASQIRQKQIKTPEDFPELQDLLRRKRKAKRLKNKFHRQAKQENKIWSISKQLAPKNSIRNTPIITSTGPVYNPEEKAEAIAKVYEAQFTPNPEVRELRQHYESIQREMQHILQIRSVQEVPFVTPMEIYKILKQSPCNRAPGSDGIPYAALKMHLEINEIRQKYDFCGFVFLKPVHVQNGSLPPQYTPNNDVQQSDIPTGLLLMEYHYRHVQSELSGVKSGDRGGNSSALPLRPIHLWVVLI